MRLLWPLRWRWAWVEIYMPWYKDTDSLIAYQGLEYDEESGELRPTDGSKA